MSLYVIQEIAFLCAISHSILHELLEMHLFIGETLRRHLKD